MVNTDFFAILIQLRMLLLGLSWPSILTIFDPVIHVQAIIYDTKKLLSQALQGALEQLELFLDKPWGAESHRQTRLLKWSNDSLVELDSSTWINMGLSENVVYP